MAGTERDRSRRVADNSCFVLLRGRLLLSILWGRDHDMARTVVEFGPFRFDVNARTLFEKSRW